MEKSGGEKTEEDVERLIEGIKKLNLKDELFLKTEGQLKEIVQVAAKGENFIAVGKVISVQGNKRFKDTLIIKFSDKKELQKLMLKGA